MFTMHTNDYAGIVESAVLSAIIQNFTVSLTGFIMHSMGEEEDDEREETRDVDNPTMDACEILIYGLKSEADTIGDILSEHELFLQHPQEYDDRVTYHNPQYLLRP